MIDLPDLNDARKSTTFKAIVDAALDRGTLISNGASATVHGNAKISQRGRGA
ncbi:hypothetical protein SAMN05443245_3542 [Paraburkholderia fungorum]|uniref:Uncharacterized protein n=1 Tax=Paraburkholderia fungorum TaxID=134537 RepID=A0A1H1H5C0_9BURK|nr:hypothetical protein SAMN05443245_3542 [Paraburkholderia fungorum]